uniref:D-Ala-D-Ala carboxypeptidase VanY n=1 Tax=Kurthia massiliensis TaxID=1033739 RepID=UPI00028855B2|nr:D-Ala-D-Ala carboxypeptidase VanY [Kurthia massiliensis]
MKKIALALVAIILALVVYNVATLGHENDDTVKQTPKKPTTQTVSVTADDITQGPLVLINHDHEVDDRAVPEDLLTLSKHPKLLKGFTISDDSIQVARDMLASFQVMVDDAKKDDVTHFVINSSYRSKAVQAELYETKGADIALPPGASEHNLGLSMDIGSSLGLMENAEEGKWLAKNAAKYGFILRYPEDKTDITGIQYEAWHFRYVGLPHSLIMQQHDWVLEEYIDYLKTHDRLTETVDGVRYTVFYQDVAETGNTDIQLPLKRSYTISGDNDNGVIVTYWNPQQADMTETSH